MNILHILIDDENLKIIIPWWLLLLFLILIGVLFLLRSRKFFLKDYKIEEVEIGIRDYRVKIKPSFEDIQVAYKIWVEISTRKLGLEIDEENDVIVEVYNSWYEFFKITRETLKEIPAHKIVNPETQKIIDVSLKLLNEVVRPHLTKWQARFRKWYYEEKEKNKSLTPQKIQRQYPHYEELIKDMKKVNKNIMEYRKSLEKLIGFHKSCEI
ncbi:hypothetical protein [Thermodesulfobacterium hydrogeniphilum]|uniref:hypothetical protein n=1 Tax=Thermodesulfobacterium hydrogeniphilum TaxID=161156 RepID=UPI00056EA77F|nr:hypothetical protein [Thermodesulfobacterium hydrogeniphilum]